MKPLAKGATNSFIAGAAGGATFHGRVDGDLLAATQLRQFLILQRW